MEKTINCAKCHKDFTYEEKPGYPRKYCLNCSAEVKRSYAEREEAKPEPTASGSMEYETPGFPKEKPAKEYHLSPEQVDHNEREGRKWALDAAITCLEDKSSEPLNLQQIVLVAKQFEEYLWNGN